MSTPPPPEEPEVAPPESEADPVRARKLKAVKRRWSRRRVGTVGLAVLVLLVLLAGLTVRFGVLTDPGRVMVARMLEGQRVGPFGRLHIEGIGGDVFGDFTVRRIALVDPKGEWLEAREVAMRWSAHELVNRVFHAQSLRATVVRVARRPVLEQTGGGGGGGLPVNILIDDLKMRLETQPAFSARQGVWDVAGQADIRRNNGGASGHLDAQSRLHAGDGLALLFRIDPRGRILVRADAVEGMGGAFAGALGLPADQRFFVNARVDGDSTESGTISVTTQAGGRRPVVASGRWDKAGASLDATVLLGVSSLTAPFAERVGPEARLTLNARNIRTDLYQLDGALRAREATVTFKGPIDTRRRSTDGLALDLGVTDVTRWAEVVQAGAARAVGTLKGDLSQWRFESKATVDKLDQLGYRLARIAGPVAVSRNRGEIRVEADVTGAGGAGEGLVPGLLGAAPRVKLDGARLDEGRILIRRLEVVAPGLAVTATGDRSIFGALNFKGDLVASGLERASPGAKGSLRASWTARQSGRNPWEISVDARGESFASGYPELDRLLGSAPRATASATYGPALQITKSQLTGEAAQAAVRGSLDQEMRLAFDVDWSARGPFAVGPVEIAGQATGAGKVGGRLPNPTVDLTADLASLDVGQLVIAPARLTLALATEGGLNGKIGLTGSSTWGPASAGARFQFAQNGLDLTEIAADGGGVKAAGSLALRDGAPSSADLTLSAGPGALLTSGQLKGAAKITGRPGGAAAQITVDGQNLVFPGGGFSLRTLRLRADGPWERLPYQIALAGAQPVPWRLGGQGMLTQTGAGAEIVREISLSGAGRLRQADIKTREPAVVRFGPAERTARLRLAIASGEADVDARETDGGFEAKGQASGVDIAAFASDYIGKLSGSLNLSGRGSRLAGTVEAAVEGGRDRDAPADVALSARMRAVLDNDRVRVDATATNPMGLTSKLDLTLPAETSASPFRIALARTRPISGAFEAQGELGPLWDLVGGGGLSISGKGSVQASLSGTINRPRATGQAGLEGGRLEDSGTGFDLRNVSAQANFDRGAVALSRFSGDDGRGGTMTGSGNLSLASQGDSSLTLQLQRFQVIDNDLARASASGQVVVTRDAAGKAQLRGTLTIDHADITAAPPVPSGVVPMEVVEINKPGQEDGEPGAATGRGGPQIAMDVAVRASRGVMIRGNGLDAEFSVDAHVGGTTAAPVLTGVARVVRGGYEFAGKRFEFDDRGTIRLASTPEGIRIDLTAVREDPALTARVEIRGTAARPEITLSSTPVLPQDEVLSQVLFGRSASQLSPLEAAQLASAVTALATGGGLDVLGGLRQLAGLDRLALSGGGAGGAAVVSGGKYLTDDVYLELTGGGRNGPTAQVEWRVRRNLSVVSTVGSQGTARLSVRFRRNF